MPELYLPRFAIERLRNQPPITTHRNRRSFILDVWSLQELQSFMPKKLRFQLLCHLRQTLITQPRVNESTTRRWHGSSNAQSWLRKHSLIFNEVYVFVKQVKRCINKSYSFFLNWTTYFSFLTPFDFRIVNNGVLNVINF